LPRRVWFALAVSFVAIGFAWYVSGHPMDFRVYYHEAQTVFVDKGPVYGQLSGLGWPMHYRYPPPFLFLALPFTVLPLSFAAAFWVLLKCIALGLLILALWNRLGPSTRKASWIVPLLLAGPYVVEDLRYGNAQSFIFALTGAALLSLTAAPLLAAAALALAISIKVWPLYFVPYLAARREWKVVGLTLAFTAVLLLLPALYFGFQGNAGLLSEWVQQEFSTQTSQAEIWFPSQSLRGVMMRYLTVIDYSRVPDSNYPLIQVATMAPDTVRMLWMIVVGLGYIALIVVTVRRKNAKFGLTEALAFTGLVLLEPFSQKYALVVLLWPAIVAGRLVESSPARGLLYAAVIVTLVQPVINGAAAQRLMQVLGFDFLATALLAAFLLISILAPSTERYAPG
jgi:Glycosyltransferase family 87